MLTANELRIGNLIEYNGMNVTIFSINKKEFVTFDTAQVVIGGRKYEQSPSLHLKNFIPIPLTEEWMLKFGFDKDGEQGKCIGFKAWEVVINNGFFIVVHETGDYRRNFIEIKYVHQLQNLYFALTGEELTLKD